MISPTRLVNLTMYAEFSSDFNLKNLVTLIPCVKIRDYIFDPDKPLPYFGVENIFVSKKSHLWGSEGARCQTKDGKYPGAMKNCVSIDYQVLQKNNNIKIFKNLFHMCGLACEEEGEIITQLLIDTIAELEEIWRPFYNLSVIERYEFINTVVIPIVMNDSGDLFSVDDLTLIQRYDETCETLDKNLIDSLRMCIAFSEFHPNLQSFLAKLDIIVNLSVNDDSIFTKEGKVVFSGFSEQEGIYNNKLPFSSLVLGFIVVKLIEMGIDASFSNEKDKKIQINVISGIEDGKMTPVSLIHQITLNYSGTLKIISPGKTELVIAEVDKIINVICKIIRSDEYPKKSKSKVKDRLNTKILQVANKFIEIESPTTSVESASSLTDLSF